LRPLVLSDFPRVHEVGESKSQRSNMNCGPVSPLLDMCCSRLEMPGERCLVSGQTNDQDQMNFGSIMSMQMRSTITCNAAAANSTLPDS
jgi:hypothetical protein